MKTKVLTREEMADEIATFVNSLHKDNTWFFMKTTEEFNGSKGGLWFCGECEDIVDSIGLPMFEYYAYDMNIDGINPYRDYVFGVHPAINDFVEERGWFFEWNDPGTIMLWPA